MKILAHGLSDKGLSRKHNEDSFYADKDLGLFVVADGMGGHSAGEVASKMAVETLSGYIRKSCAGVRMRKARGRSQQRRRKGQYHRGSGFFCKGSLIPFQTTKPRLAHKNHW